MNTNFILFLIHLVATVAVFINVGLKEDGYENGKWRLQGKVATIILAIDFIAFMTYVFSLSSQFVDLVNLYLGYSITVASFIIPFLCTCHNIVSNRIIRLNFVGWLTVVLALVGLVSTFLHLLGVSDENVENYIAVLANLITVTSALIALSGQTFDNQYRLTDLGRVAVTVITVGFMVSVMNGYLDEREKEKLEKTVSDVDKKAKETLGSLNKAGEFLDEINEGLAKSKEDLTSIFSAELNLVKEELRIVKSDLEGTQKNLVKDVHELDELTKQLQDKLASIERDIDIVDDLVADMSTDYLDKAVFNQEINKLSGNVASKQEVKSQTDNLLNQINAVRQSALTKGDLSQLASTSDLNALRTDVNNKLGSIGDNQIALQSLTTTINNLNQKITNLENLIQKLPKVGENDSD